MVSPNSLYGRLDDPARDAGYVDPPPRKGFFTDTSVCIGCKACEVACKEWNAVPEDGIDLLGLSYDNTGGLGADSWRASRSSSSPGPRSDRMQQDTAAAGFDAFAEAARLGTGVPGGHPVAERAYQNSSHGGAGVRRFRWWLREAPAAPGGEGRRRAVPRHARDARARPAAGPGRPPGRALADDVQRLQALHARGLPRRVPHRCPVPDRVRHRRRAAGRLQRLRLLRPRPAPTASSTSARTTAGPGSARCATTGWARTRPRVRQGVPHGVHPVR